MSFRTSNSPSNWWNPPRSRPAQLLCQIVPIPLDPIYRRHQTSCKTMTILIYKKNQIKHLLLVIDWWEGGCPFNKNDEHSPKTKQQPHDVFNIPGGGPTNVGVWWVRPSWTVVGFYIVHWAETDKMVVWAFMWWHNRCVCILAPLSQKVNNTVCVCSHFLHKIMLEPTWVISAYYGSPLMSMIGIYFVYINLLFTPTCCLFNIYKC